MSGDVQRCPGVYGVQSRRRISNYFLGTELIPPRNYDFVFESAVQRYPDMSGKVQRCPGVYSVQSRRRRTNYLLGTQLVPPRNYYFVLESAVQRCLEMPGDVRVCTVFNHGVGEIIIYWGQN